jgi:hypothetical protein
MINRFLVAVFFAFIIGVALTGDAEAQVRSCVNANSCGQYSSSGGCWCDDGCLVYHDCCDDRVQICKTPQMSVASVTPSAMATNFTGQVVIRGTGLFDPASTASDVTVKIGFSSCVGVTLGPLSITCMLMTPPSSTRLEITTVWDNWGFTPTLLQQIPGTFTTDTKIAFRPPTISSITTSSTLTSGGYAMDIAGADFGANGATVSVGGSSCLVSSQTHVLLRCTVPAGKGAALPVVVVTAGAQSATGGFSYGAPVIASTSPALLNTAGASSLTMAGTNFGGTTGASVIVGGNPCPVVSQSHIQIVCTLAAGQGNNLPLQVTVQGQVSAPKYVSYASPLLTSIVPASGPAAGNTPVTINGTNLGQSGIVTIAGVPCALTSWTHTQIKCTTPPGNYTSPLQVTTAGQLSNLASFAYLPLPFCAANQFVVGGLACTPCAPGTMSAGGSVTSCMPIVCPSPQVLDVATNSCGCATPPSGFYLTNAATCATSPVTATIFLRAECVEPLPSQPGTRIVHFGYLNNYAAGGSEIVRPYGAGTNTVTIDGVDAGPLSGAPIALEYGSRSNAFSLRYSPGQIVTWSVLDPVALTMATASPAAATPACTTLMTGPMGPQGNPGANGANGMNGSIGPIGLTGAQGFAGPAGAPGDAGNAGAIGDKGETGFRGSIGATGERGPVGDTGAQGPAGLEGPSGITGLQGPVGDRGPNGPQGSVGTQGIIGDRGSQGPVGDQGSIGERGPIGDRGATGIDGERGSPGDQGPRGPVGGTGSIGAQGPKGPDGVVETGFVIYVRSDDPAPAGYTYVRSYIEKLEKNGPVDSKEIVIRVYRKNP